MGFLARPSSDFLDPAEINYAARWRRVDAVALWPELLLLIESDKGLQLTLSESVADWAKDNPFAGKLLKRPWRFEDKSAPPPFILARQSVEWVAESIRAARVAGNPRAECLYGLHLLAKHRSLIEITPKALTDFEKRGMAIWRHFLPQRDDIRWLTPLPLESSHAFAPFVLHLACRYAPDGEWTILAGENYSVVLDPRERIIFDLQMIDNPVVKAPLALAMGLTPRTFCEIHEAPDAFQEFPHKSCENYLPECVCIARSLAPVILAAPFREILSLGPGAD